MALKSWLKKAAVILPLAFSAGCDYFAPNGMPVKQDADGVLTAEEERGAKEALETKSYINDFASFRPLANDFNVYADNNFRQQGLLSVRFSDDLHISFVDNTADYCDTNNPWVSPACSKSFNSTLYFKRDNFKQLYFLRTFHHEIGHQMRADGYEFSSEANKAYFLLNIYGFNKIIGSAFADLAFSPPSAIENSDGTYTYCQPVNEYMAGDFRKYYGYGDLGFLIMANSLDGNLEKAVDKIMRAPRLYLEHLLDNAAAAYGNMCEAMVGEYGKLLQNQNFQAKLKERMSNEEMLEYIAYLRLAANDSIGYPLSEEGLAPFAEWKARTISEGEDFISRFGNNPYFRQMAMNMVSEAYIGLAGEMIASGESYSGGKMWEVHRIAKKVIDMNKDYPCAFDIYECPGLLSEPRKHHALAYLYATYFSTEMINAGLETHASLIAIPEDYASRFYNTGNYHYEDNKQEMAIYTPQLAFFAGNLEEDMAEIATSYFDLDGMRQHICRAVEWYKIAVEAGCSRIPDAEKKEECANAVDARFENVANARIEGKRAYYEANCR